MGSQPCFLSIISIASRFCLCEILTNVLPLWTKSPAVFLCWEQLSHPNRAADLHDPGSSLEPSQVLQSKAASRFGKTSQKGNDQNRDIVAITISRVMELVKR